MLPLRFACEHDEVRVSLRDGHTVQGFSHGADWWETPTGPEVYFEIEPDGAEPTITVQADVVTVTPVGGYIDRATFLTAIDRLIDELKVSGQTEYVRLVVADHETVEVAVTWNVHPCAPPARPHTAVHSVRA
ncbi:hypothetical protein [Nocardioides thalensis]|uniref:hypothetical protein n=1 Tax=Nocardioides thalensis TaxID=1914755 RepID=UPI0015C99AA1|nr:hypothetical protein [Nocardioides thalensis]